MAACRVAVLNLKLPWQTSISTSYDADGAFSSTLMPGPLSTTTHSARVSFRTKELTFTYRDTGAPAGKKVYPTIFIIRGAYFHSGIFDARLTPLAQKQGRLRLIYINRRDYQGSTEYDELEIEVLKGDFSHREREAFLTLEGIYLALLIDGLVRDLRLPTGAGLSVLGWSLGVSFTLAIMASANSDLLPSDAKARLQDSITSFILWDPPNTSLGEESRLHVMGHQLLRAWRPLSSRHVCSSRATSRLE